MGLDYAYISVKKKPSGLSVSQTVVKEAESGASGKEVAAVLMKRNTFYLRVRITKDAVCTFSYSDDGRTFAALGEPFTARKGKWVGRRWDCLRSEVARLARLAMPTLTGSELSEAFRWARKRMISFMPASRFALGNH